MVACVVAAAEDEVGLSSARHTHQVHSPENLQLNPGVQGSNGGPTLSSPPVECVSK